MATTSRIRRSARTSHHIIGCILLLQAGQQTVQAQRQLRQVAEPADAAPHQDAEPAKQTADQSTKGKAAAGSSVGKLSPDRLAAYNNYDDYTLYTKVRRSGAAHTRAPLNYLPCACGGARSCGSIST